MLAWVIRPTFPSRPGAAFSTPMLAAGQSLFGYTIQRVLGKGGMGTVYLAIQQSLGREVALKVMHPQRMHTPQAAEAFLKEARAAAQLNHPNVVGIHAAYQDEAQGVFAYSMELVPGATLAQLLKQHGPLPRPKALTYIMQIADALGYAHRKGLVHRDVKPGNILITPDGRAKLLDLGLVQHRVDTTTNSGYKLQIVGTPDYSAPEQSRNPARATPASDVYALGATLFHVLSGKPPFSGETVIDLIVRVAVLPVEWPDTMPPDCRELLGMMLAKSPKRRLGDGAMVVEVLRAMARGERPNKAAQAYFGGIDPGGDDDLYDGDEGDGKDTAAMAAAIARRHIATRRRR